MAVVLFTLPLLGDITLGTALGVVGTIASFLFSKKPSNPLPKAMSSAWGETWPLVYNSYRLPGKCLQAGLLVENDHKGLFGSKGTSYELTFAMGVCEGPRTIGRIWADQQCIYDPRPIVTIPVRQPNHLYAAGDQVYADPSQPRWIFTATVNGETGSGTPAWNYESDQATRDGEVVWLATKYAPRNKIGKQYNFFMQIYTGTEDQLPDSALEEMVGAGNQVAYRGLVYVVFYQFDLGRYGNRIPNMEFEVLGEENTHFVSGAELYGSAFGSTTDIGSPPFVTSPGGNIFNVSHSQFANIKTLATTAIDTAVRANADATSFGTPSVYMPTAGWQQSFAVGEKYFCTLGLCTTVSPLLYWTVLLYEINDDGTYTALGCKSFQVPVSPFFASVICATIRPDTGEVMIAFADTGAEAIHLAVFGTISAMTGPWFPYNNVNRVQTPAGPGPETLGGTYAAVPGPYAGFCCSFIGADFYVTLNKAHMDYIVATGPGGFLVNAYYASLQPTYPNGVMIKVVSASDGTGDLNCIFEGPSADYGWPFFDEGLNSVGAPGQTLTTIRDDWGIPIQQQDNSGAVLGVFFARTYSDHANEIGVMQFQNRALVGSVSNAPFAVSYSGFPDQPVVVFNGDGIYGAFTNNHGGFGGPVNYFKLGAFVSSLLTLADICADISGRIGLTPSQYDYSGLASVVPTGTAFLQRDTARSYIESIIPAFFFDLQDIGPKIVGSLRSNDAVIQTIPESDLAAVQEEASIKQGSVVDKISSVKQNDIELPQDLSISYQDAQHDYQAGSQQARRSKVTQYSSGKNTVSVPVVMTPYDANTAAQRALFLLWVERTQRKIIVPPEYLQRTPVDVVNVIRANKTHTIRITMVTLKTNWTIEIQSVSEDLGTYQITGTVQSSSIANFNPSTIDPATTPVLAVVDTATLRPDDLTLPGTYVAAANEEPGSTYDTVFAQDSPDDSVFTTEATLPVASTMGSATTTLGNWVHYGIFDTVNSVTVSLLSGSLFNADKWALSKTLTTNLAWFSNGELLQFATATLLGGTGEAGDPFIYKLTGLRRGRLGTEQFIGTHGPGETFVLVSTSTMQNVTYAASEINATRYWQALNDAPVNPASPVQTLTMATRRLLPYAPSFIRSSRDMSGNLTITGKRRTRWHGQPLWTPAETDTPVTVQIDILNGVTVVRTLTTTLSANGSGVTNANSFAAYYAVADQIIDFGSPQASVSIKAYSLNATIGRGYGEARAA